MFETSLHQDACGAVFMLVEIIVVMLCDGK